jgi:hypothetical protein
MMDRVQNPVNSYNFCRSFIFKAGDKMTSGLIITNLIGFTFFSLQIRFLNTDKELPSKYVTEQLI